MTGGWRIDRRVSAGHIVTTLVVALSAIAWMMRLEGAVLLNAQAVDAQRERIDWVERAVKDDQAEIKQALLRIQDAIRRVEDRMEARLERDRR